MSANETHEYVVDTNPWVVIDRNPGTIDDLAEIDCIIACRRWFEAFMTDDARLVIDNQYAILGEYRRNIADGGRAYRILSRLERQPRERLIEVSIELDANQNAIVPSELMIADKSDRKFIAVVLATMARDGITPPIINATDTDWAKESTQLKAHGIVVVELCTNYIQTKLQDIVT